MIARLLSLLLATAAMAGAVIYAQQKAEKKENPRPIFESSKSGTPTPIEDAPPVKKPAKKDEPKPEEVKQQGAEPSQQPEKPKKKKKKVMPTSKSYIPD
jgi:outer membrane biosynthesis protein TonB